MHRVVPLIAPLIAALVLGGCSGDSGDSADTADTDPSEVAAPASSSVSPRATPGESESSQELT